MYYPNICFCGHGRAGKDTAALITALYTDMKYTGSLSSIACPMIAASLNKTPEEAWNQRHKHRMYWYEFLNDFRRDDPAKLIKLQLEQGPLCVGVRNKAEIEAAKKQNLFELIIWIDRDVDDDPTVTYTKREADLIIDNNEDVYSLRDKLLKILQWLTPVTYNPPYQKFSTIMDSLPTFISKTSYTAVFDLLKNQA